MNRLRYILMFALLPASLAPILALAQPGTLDSSFGTGGVAFLGSGTEGTAVAFQADGKIIVAGGSGTDAALWRLHPDGSADLTFGSEGLVTVDFGGPDDNFLDVEVLPSGAILVAGTKFLDASGSAVGDDAIVARFLPDGSLDPAFGTDGLVIEPGTEGTPDAFWSVDVRPDGRIMAGGARGTFSGACYAVQYLENGTRDAAFGTDGVVTVSLPGGTWCLEGALYPDGRYAFSGNPIAFEFVAIRLLEDGTPDPSFDGDGLAVTSGVGGLFTQAMEAMPDGGVMALGTDTNELVMLVRFGSDGALDPTFGTGGIVRFLVLAPAHLFGSAQQSDGKVLLTGIQRLPSGVDDLLFLARVMPDGTLDPAFGTDGITLLDIGEPGGSDYGYELGLQPDGRIVAAGGADLDGLAARFLNDKVVANEPPAGVQPLAFGTPTPNPTSGPLTLAFTLPKAGVVRLALYDLLGREVAVLLNGPRAAGPHAAAFDATGLAPGVYVVRLTAGGEAVTWRLTVVR